MQTMHHSTIPMFVLAIHGCLLPLVLPVASFFLASPSSMVTRRKLPFASRARITTPTPVMPTHSLISQLHMNIPSDYYYRHHQQDKSHHNGKNKTQFMTTLCIVPPHQGMGSITTSTTYGTRSILS